MSISSIVFTQVCVKIVIASFTNFSYFFSYVNIIKIVDLNNNKKKIALQVHYKNQDQKLLKMSKLEEQLLSLSSSQNWEHAKKEWKLSTVYISTVKKKCLCGHYPCVEICELYNTVTGSIAEVGNNCVNKVFDFKQNVVFTAVKKSLKEKDYALTDAVLDFAFKHNLIDAVDKHFYHEVRNKVRRGLFINNNQQYKMAHMHSRILGQFQK